MHISHRLHQTADVVSQADHHSAPTPTRVHKSHHRPVPHVEHQVVTAKLECTNLTIAPCHMSRTKWSRPNSSAQISPSPPCHMSRTKWSRATCRGPSGHVPHVEDQVVTAKSHHGPRPTLCTRRAGSVGCLCGTGATLYEEQVVPPKLECTNLTMGLDRLSQTATPPTFRHKLPPRPHFVTNCHRPYFVTNLGRRTHRR